MKQTIVLRWLGNIMIVLSCIGFFYTLFPLMQIYFFPKHIDENILGKGEYITILKIQAQAKIIENVDPWKETVYKMALKEGVAQAKNTALPGEKGTIFLFAHSSGMPWELTNNNAPFLRLGELQMGDKIEITKNNKRYIYLVTNKKTIWPNEVQYLNKNTKDNLILQTCTPIGTSLQRLLIFAQLQAA